jgi:hypothetical protein
MGMRGSGRGFLGSVNEKGNPISRLPSKRKLRSHWNNISCLLGRFISFHNSPSKQTMICISAGTAHSLVTPRVLSPYW